MPAPAMYFAACAVEPSIVERLDYRRLAALAQKHNAWSRALHALTLLFSARKEAREREFLTLDPEGRYLAFCSECQDLVRRIPQKISRVDLLAFLGPLEA